MVQTIQKYRYVGTYYRQKKSIFIKDKERKEYTVYKGIV